MVRILPASVICTLALSFAVAQDTAKTPAKVEVGQKAPDFTFKDQSGKTINLAELCAKGPVLVRLTCGCSCCDKELAYFQEIDAAYKKYGVTSIAIFKEPDGKVAKYATEKKINMLYGVDSKGKAWETFQTKTMPTNFLIGKGGEMIKRIGTEARKDLQEMLAGPVYLDLHVKVREGWREDERMLDSLGLPSRRKGKSG